MNECESLLISLKETNKNSLYLLEQKKHELNTVQSELQTLKYEQSATATKVCLLREGLGYYNFCLFSWKDMKKLIKNVNDIFLYLNVQLMNINVYYVNVKKNLNKLKMNLNIMS